MEFTNSTYIFIGTLIMTNIGTIVAVIWFLIKGSWWLSAKFSNLEFTQKEHTKDIDAAHVQIRELKRDVNDLGRH